MARTTTKAVNAALKAAGFDCELIRGNGYFYFWNGEAVMWFSSSVYVYRLTDLTVEEWVEEAKFLSGRKAA